MAQIIHIRDIEAKRRRSRCRIADHESLELAIQLLKDSLVRVAEQLRDASTAEHAELLERIERLTALIRYGMRMLGETPGSHGGDSATAESH